VAKGNGIGPRYVNSRVRGFTGRKSIILPFSMGGVPGGLDKGSKLNIGNRVFSDMKF
jgi:hypothetical protein